jgi:hypothetical protein
MTLVEVMFAVAILLLMFGGIGSSFHVIMSLIGSSKAQAGAVSLANKKMEYIRSLAYDSVGTIAGIPDGALPQTSSTTLNGILYTERILIQYIDDAKDGTGASDTNGIVSDYKLAKVTYSWSERGVPKSISILSNIIPKGIETTAGGGTLTVNVFDSSAQPVSNASVRVYNNTGTTTIDTTRFTNAAGVAMFAGAPARANYQITVTKAGFSTDKTYSATSSNPNPAPPHVAVLVSQVSTMNFQIDELSSLAVKTVGLPTTNFFEDTFASTTTIASSSQVTVVSDEVRLSGGVGSYSPLGKVFSTVIDPGTFTSWGAVSFESNTPGSTDLMLHIYDATSSTSPVLIPDSELPGNSAGFTGSTINLLALDSTTYPQIILGATLSTSNSSQTPSLGEWKVTYTTAQPVLASIPVTLTGAKTVGTTAGGLPVYKYLNSFSTNGSGLYTLSNVEYDVYTVVMTDPSYDIVESCRAIPYVLRPGVTETLTLTLAPASTYSLNVRVVDSSGVEIPDADVTFSRPSFNESQSASACGQAYFGIGLTSATNYVLDVAAFGYVDQSIIDVAIAGNETMTVTLVSL